MFDLYVCVAFLLIMCFTSCIYIFLIYFMSLTYVWFVYVVSYCIIILLNDVLFVGLNQINLVFVNYIIRLFDAG